MALAVRMPRLVLPRSAPIAHAAVSEDTAGLETLGAVLDANRSLANAVLVARLLALHQPQAGLSSVLMGIAERKAPLLSSALKVLAAVNSVSVV